MKRYDPERLFTVIVAFLAFVAVMSGYDALAGLLMAILIVGTAYARAVFRDAGEG